MDAPTLATLFDKMFGWARGARTARRFQEVARDEMALWLGYVVDLDRYVQAFREGIKGHEGQTANRQLMPQQPARTFLTDGFADRVVRAGLSAAATRALVEGLRVIGEIEKHSRALQLGHAVVHHPSSLGISTALTLPGYDIPYGYADRVAAAAAVLPNLCRELSELLDEVR